MRWINRVSCAAAIVSVWLVGALPVGAESIAGTFFNNTWGYTDQPVATHKVNRTWMWGPTADSPALFEPYVESPNGQREVQYFDKTRMEVTHPGGDSSSIWYVTNGLLAEELITGRLQLGDNSFEQHSPAEVNVAGDANDPNGPTYATFNPLMSYGAIPNGWKITQTIDRAGNVGDDQNLASYNVTAKDVGATTNHNVASVFWDFMNSRGTVYQNGSYSTAKLFTNPFYATGYPLTEAYWTSVLVGGVHKQVLVQVFERRVLTYTPSNSDGWKVEAGNVGQHYYTWRYTQLGKTVTVASNQPAPPAPTPTPTGAKTSFGDGVWQVGTQIVAGTYWTVGTSLCYWERDSDLSGSLDAILANDTVPGQDIVTILASDKGFKSQGCGTWQPIALLPAHQPTTASFGDGLYQVGSQVAAGTWTTTGGSACYWARLNGFSGSLGNVIANDIPNGPVTVQISATDVGFQTQGCGNWTYQGG